MKSLNEKLVSKYIGNKLKEHRKNQNITQSQLAYESGIPRVQVGRIERGEINTTIKTLIQISKALNVQPSAFFDFILEDE
ncbi:MAG: helix-turn-helix transcriptional regulator [Flavobacteriia bacterium]|nr:helix-turn-helix transcriptional regulator [Flavobacteriia bacterium]